MKVTFDIDCTPEEARRFLGLPDVAPMQDAVMKEMQDRAVETIRSMDPESMVKSWFPASLQGLSDMQKMFWSQMGVQMPDSRKKTGK